MFCVVTNAAVPLEARLTRGHISSRRSRPASFSSCCLARLHFQLPVYVALYSRNHTFLCEWDQGRNDGDLRWGKELKVGNAFSCLLSSGQYGTVSDLGSLWLRSSLRWSDLCRADEMPNIALHHHEHGAYSRGLGEKSELSHTDCVLLIPQGRISGFPQPPTSSHRPFWTLDPGLRV